MKQLIILTLHFLLSPTYHLAHAFSTSKPYLSTIKRNEHSNTLQATSFAETITSSFTEKKTKIIKGDDEYPWVFTGRLWFRPSIVKIPSSFKSIEKNSIVPLNLFGYTVGGSVALEYDTSPIGPYKEYVTMGSLAAKSEDLVKIYLGQWGENLYVSTKEAASICDDIWGVPAQMANINFMEDSEDVYIQSAPSSLPPKSSKNGFDFGSFFSSNQQSINNIQVNGWTNTRKCKDNDLTLEKIKSRPSVNMYWTPTIKALWLPFNVPFFQQYKNTGNDSESSLPFHKLRLSADSIGIVKSNQIVRDSEMNTDSLGFTFPFGLVVDNVAIEISPTIGNV